MKNWEIDRGINIEGRHDEKQKEKEKKASVVVKNYNTGAVLLWLMTLLILSSFHFFSFLFFSHFFHIYRSTWGIGIGDFVLQFDAPGNLGQPIPGI